MGYLIVVILAFALLAGCGAGVGDPDTGETPQGGEPPAEAPFDGDLLARIAGYRPAGCTPSLDYQPIAPVSGTEICDSATRNAACGWFHDRAAGEAGGLAGVSYQNADGGHSTVPYDGLQGITTLPQLALQPLSRLFPNQLVVGNVSAAYTDEATGGSIPRVAFMRSQSGADSVLCQYLANVTVVYPEHRDHDSVSAGGRGNLFFAMHPYTVISQGSSGSDQVFVQDFFYLLGALRPEVRLSLQRLGLVIPAAQMIFRRARASSDEEYLSGLANPSAFPGGSDRLKLVTLANSIQNDTIPPVAALRVESENFTTVDFKKEIWFTTPFSIARIFRERVYTKSITLNGQESVDVNRKPLRFYWRVLHGSTDRARIIPLNATHSRVRVELDYQPTFTMSYDPQMTSNLTTVALYVHNGHFYSPPAFVTAYTLPNEDRVYDGAGNFISATPNSNPVDYAVK